MKFAIRKEYEKDQKIMKYMGHFVNCEKKIKKIKIKSEKFEYYREQRL